MTTEHTTGGNPTEVVLSFIRALNDEDFTTARKYLKDDFKFEGVMGSRDSAQSYIDDMQKMKFKYEIKKVFVENNDVCLWYDIDMGGKKVFCSGWYQIKDTQITNFKVLFDPRPLLEQKK